MTNSRWWWWWMCQSSGRALIQNRRLSLGTYTIVTDQHITARPCSSVECPGRVLAQTWARWRSLHHRPVHWALSPRYRRCDGKAKVLEMSRCLSGSSVHSATCHQHIRSFILWLTFYLVSVSVSVSLSLSLSNSVRTLNENHSICILVFKYSLLLRSI